MMITCKEIHFVEINVVKLNHSSAAHDNSRSVTRSTKGRCKTVVVFYPTFVLDRTLDRSDTFVLDWTRDHSNQM